jgi:hypothetical protein
MKVQRNLIWSNKLKILGELLPHRHTSLTGTCEERAHCGGIRAFQMLFNGKFLALDS